ncbi:MAG: DUF4159 domain-containing protein [Acidobacteria bacterium]|nr:DUF4159 domain-containing protein [Acidobacteriota bacterium]
MSGVRYRLKSTETLVCFVIFVCFVISCLDVASVSSQRLYPRSEFTQPKNKKDTNRSRGEFTFARLRYQSDGWRGEAWETDYPKADEQFLEGLRGWVKSGLSISTDPTTVSFDQKDLQQYPFIYAVEPGQMELSNEDAANLREYLLRGGFLMLDDFWGEYEWQNVRRQMFKVFPEYQIKDLPLTHTIFHCYFDLDELIQIPNVQNIIYRGRTDEKGGITPYYHGIVDDNDRIMVFIARNSDNGDAWEWIDDPRYPLKYGLAAYKLGMNLIVYSMTH